MKKFLQICVVTCLSLVMTNACFAGCSSPITLGYDGSQRPEDNEFLYPTEYDWNAAVNGYNNARNKNGQTSGDGKGYECDEHNSASCGDGDIVTLQPGHYFKEEKINYKRSYKCDTWGGDSWEPIDSMNQCDAGQFGQIPINNKYKSRLTLDQCSGWNVTDKTNGTKFELWCYEGPELLCKAVECKDNMVPNSKGICQPSQQPSTDKCTGSYSGHSVELLVGRIHQGHYLSKKECTEIKANGFDSNGTKFQLDCVAGPKFRCCPTDCVQGKIPDTKNCVCRSTGVIPGKPCTEKRKGKPVGVACCNLEDAGLATYDAKKDVCTCKDASRTFAIDQSNGTGMCVDNTPVKPDCDESTGAHLNEKTNKCECPSAELTLNADGVSCSCVDPDKVYKNGKCVYTEEYLLRIRITQIREIRARLDGIMSGLKVSVWKDEEGNFNTARLASDSIAGVVLGTVGGVVTSVIVKKNQIKKGFEAIQCAIGGQTVANYGDEFVVGPAR